MCLYPLIQILLIVCVANEVPLGLSSAIYSSTDSKSEHGPLEASAVAAFVQRHDAMGSVKIPAQKKPISSTFKEQVLSTLRNIDSEYGDRMKQLSVQRQKAIGDYISSFVFKLPNAEQELGMPASQREAMLANVRIRTKTYIETPSFAVTAGDKERLGSQMDLLSDVIVTELGVRFADDATDAAKAATQKRIREYLQRVVDNDMTPAFKEAFSEDDMTDVTRSIASLLKTQQFDREGVAARVKAARDEGAFTQLTLDDARSIELYQCARPALTNVEERAAVKYLQLHPDLSTARSNLAAEAAEATRMAMQAHADVARMQMDYTVKVAAETPDPPAAIANKAVASEAPRQQSPRSGRAAILSSPMFWPLVGLNVVGLVLAYVVMRRR